MNNHIQPKYEPVSQKIKVLGLGGSGCNTISRLSALNLEGVGLIAALPVESIPPAPCPFVVLMPNRMTLSALQVDKE